MQKAVCDMGGFLVKASQHLTINPARTSAK
jgi:hypothetical protein